MVEVKVDATIALVLMTAGLIVSKATEREIALATRLLNEYQHINSAAGELRRQLRE